MKTQELFEDRGVQPDWVKQANDSFVTLLKRYGFTCRKKPTAPLGTLERWVFGGELTDISRDSMLSLDRRVLGLQKAVAKMLHDFNQAGNEVFTLDTRWYANKPDTFVTGKDFRQLYPDDTLAYVEQRIRDKLYISTSHAGKTVAFRFALTAAKEEVKQAEKPRVLRVIKKAA